MESYKQHSKHGVESGAIVGSLDVLKEKPMEAIGRIDGSVLGAISSTFGQEASLEVQGSCLALQDGKSLFDGSVSAKLNEIYSHILRSGTVEGKKEAQDGTNRRC